MKLSFLRTCFTICFLGSLTFFFFRFLQFYIFADTSLFPLYTKEILAAFFLGLRFDLKITSIICLAVCLPVSLILTQVSSASLKSKIQKVLLFCLFFLFLLMATTQYYYYGFYKTPFSPLIFGLVDDDTTGIVLSVWETYPLFKILLILTGMAGLFVYITMKVGQTPKKSHPLSILCCLVLLGGLARGTIGVFPLRLQNMTVSVHPFINDLVGNAFQTLYEAYQTHKEQAKIHPDAASELKRFGFSSLTELAQTLGAPSGTEEDLINYLHHQTPKNLHLENQPPHVIFVLMESWGAHQLRFSTTHTNLTGALGKYLQQDYYFENFFPAQIGTHPSLESLLINTPLTPLTLGSYAFIPYHSAAAKPFKEKGYKTIFIYGGSNGWRELYKSIPHLSFDILYDMAHIKERYPEAEGHVWGIYDEYLLKFAFDVLQECEAKGEKVLLFILNTTNHPPYTLSPLYQPLPLDTTEMDKVAVNPPATTYKMALTYQYANHQLGLFIDKIRQSSFGDKSIIAAAGDHSTRTFFHYTPEQTKDMYRIGCIFSVPAPYRPSSEPHLKRYADHKDIFPTLYHLALSDARYPAFGHNLFTSLDIEKEYAIVMYDLLFAPEGVIHHYTSAQPVVAGWQDPAHLYTDPTIPISPQLVEKGKKARALTALMDWYIRYQVNTLGQNAKK